MLSHHGRGSHRGGDACNGNCASLFGQRGQVSAHIPRRLCSNSRKVKGALQPEPSGKHLAITDVRKASSSLTNRGKARAIQKQQDLPHMVLLSGHYGIEQGHLSVPAVSVRGLLGWGCPGRSPCQTSQPAAEQHPATQVYWSPLHSHLLLQSWHATGQQLTGQIFKSGVESAFRPCSRMPHDTEMSNSHLVQPYPWHSET